MFPEPPVLLVSDAVKSTSLLLFSAAAIIALGVAIHLARKTRQAWPVLLYVGSCFAGLYEVVLDPMAKVAWPRADMYFYELLGQHIPLYALPMYVVYFGGAGLALWLLIDRGVTQRTWWRLYPVHIAAVTAFEIIPLHFSIWKYWGFQPFPIGGFPLPWGFANCAMLTNSVAIIYLVHRCLLRPGLGRLSLVVMYPLAAAGVHLMVMMPMYLTMTSTDSELIISLAGILVCALSVGQTWIVGHFVTTDGRANKLLSFAEPAAVEAEPTTEGAAT